MIGVAAPSPLWFATRGTGIATLVLLTTVVVLGIVSATGARSWIWPRFLSAGLHRNLSLLTVAFLALHIVTAVADPFANLGWRAAMIPFSSSYRPFWLGLGVVSSELLAALVVTSLFRPHLGHRPWRATHWLAYAAWAIALVHGLGTGTDARAPWSIGLTLSCTIAVVLAISTRLSGGAGQTAGLRKALSLAMALAVAGLSGWAVEGPLAPGWARRAGTPPPLSGSLAVASPASNSADNPATVIAPGVIQDALSGSYVRLISGETRLLLTDLRDPSIQLIVRSAGTGDPGPVLAVVHNGRVGCIAPVVALGLSLSATCGKTTLLIQVSPQGKGSSIAGTLLIQPA